MNDYLLLLYTNSTQICNLDFLISISSYMYIIKNWETLLHFSSCQFINFFAFFLAKETSTGFTPRASESNNKTTNGLDLDSDDDDDDMSDIFERARKKYNLEIDDETMSRSRK